MDIKTRIDKEQQLYRIFQGGTDRAKRSILPVHSDVSWLKATLQLFPQVRRVLPFGGWSFKVSPEIVAFTE